MVIRPEAHSSHSQRTGSAFLFGSELLALIDSNDLDSAATAVEDAFEACSSAVWWFYVAGYTISGGI